MTLKCQNDFNQSLQNDDLKSKSQLLTIKQTCSTAYVLHIFCRTYLLVVRELKISDARYKRSVPQECGVHEQLYNFIDAANRNHSCYIAAAFKSTEIGEIGKDIDVGDGRVIGGFYNAPLEEKRGYGIILGAQGLLEVSNIIFINHETNVME